VTRDEVQALFRNQRAALDRSIQRVHATVAEVTALLPPKPQPREVELWSPLPPSWNRVFKARAMPIGGGKFTAQVYKTAEAKEYAKAVAAGAAKAGVVMFPKGCMLRFSGVITMERAGCDLDDRLKVYFDALNGVVFEDDEQVAELSDVRRKVGKSPGIQAVFTPIPVDRYGDPL
jgi:Holliday junction resolvase RusA-like endonuclease